MDLKVEIVKLSVKVLKLEPIKKETKSAFKLIKKSVKEPVKAVANTPLVKP